MMVAYLENIADGPHQFIFIYPTSLFLKKDFKKETLNAHTLLFRLIGDINIYYVFFMNHAYACLNILYIVCKQVRIL